MKTAIKYGARRVLVGALVLALVGCTAPDPDEAPARDAPYGYKEMCAREPEHELCPH